MNKVLKSPSRLLRVEGVIVFIIALVLYSRLESSWLLFVPLFFAPDVSMAGYAINTRLGATIYNLVHAYALPAVLGLVGLFMANNLLASLSLIWFAHIGIDRLLGFGLKYPTEFKDTHLQHL